MLADASYALYQTERHPVSRIDWQATLVAGHHAVRGAEVLVRDCPTGCLLPCLGALTISANDVAERYAHVADALLHREKDALARPLPDAPATEWPTHLGSDLYHMSDLRVWLDGLRDDLGRLMSPAPEAEGDLRTRVTHLADGAPG
jgi:hypothetical protein